MRLIPVSIASLSCLIASRMTCLDEPACRNGSTWNVERVADMQNVNGVSVGIGHIVREAVRRNDGRNGEAAARIDRNGR